MNILLVEPDFPYPSKSKNSANSTHKNFVPIGLLKLSSLYKNKYKSTNILVRGNVKKEIIGFKPDEILVTSLFTYWSKYVWNCICYYRKMFPSSIIRLGGIYSTLHADNKVFLNLAKNNRVKIFKGLNYDAEKYLPDYSIVGDVEYHATHIMRGCIRKCEFCGTWKLEPKLIYKKCEEIVKEIETVGKTKVIFYDNNILANPYIKEVLQELEKIRIGTRFVTYEAQSGFDGRIVQKNTDLAKQIRKARFSNIKIAWDNSVKDSKNIKDQIRIFEQAGFKAKDISVFMIYNYKVSYGDMLKKIVLCEKLGVQINDCRFRPLESVHDEYNAHIKYEQTEKDYYINKECGWTDKLIKAFRSRVRKHNIWIRYAKDKGQKYDRSMERWSSINSIYKYFKLGTAPKYGIIENSKNLQQKIRNLNKLKGMCTRGDCNSDNIRRMSVVELEKFMSKNYKKPSNVEIPRDQEKGTAVLAQ